jgi:hypothetical protein
MLVFCLIFSVAYQWLNRQPDPLSGI